MAGFITRSTEVNKKLPNCYYFISGASRLVPIQSESNRHAQCSEETFGISPSLILDNVRIFNRYLKFFAHEKGTCSPSHFDMLGTDFLNKTVIILNDVFLKRPEIKLWHFFLYSKA